MRMFVQERAANAGQHKDDQGESNDSYREPVSLNAYRQIFNNGFNLEFHKPKTDRCDQCEAYRNNPDKTQKATENHRLHIERIIRYSNERAERCRQKLHRWRTSCSLYRLGNVITLPRSNISSMFYKRKLNMYNMTGHLSKNNQTKALCVVWTGRAGNDTASAVYRMLQEVFVLQPQLKRLVIWSDACVPQNRNSIMSTAIMKFMITKCAPVLSRSLESLAIPRFKKSTISIVRWRSV